MSVSSEDQGGSKDTLLWGLVFIILIAAVAGNWWVGKHFNDVNVALRALGVLVAIAAAGVLALRTVKGKATLAFARESRLEVRKVVWPTRQEAIQTTLIVLAVTAVMGLLLFVLDGALVWLVNLITGV
ncbi:MULTISPECIES: preprotein translocase subunit SecE [Aeromonas]|uniref:Protein translocase subunit SecE n=1 Tax=Aeromonas taiwanensis TaxID=633417 RepID=A0A5F0KGU4_9GAMM|nr:MULTISPECIES: preprotein translocase subunit SecE [Aeromonas]MBP4043427.1 preprotein translocase subunit SecE [Aeromonas sp. SrichE-2G]MCO4206116.1 preprotein translocase subunit SecE [Aeromonas taiwanensis]QXB56206.1 preprotein translocase subunit SecE [Aeromonas sp. FDAARGOS 1415]TFF81359.1 preprotein translocase subunit SecE [Aeromonas taiwanensis]TFF82303.1 preprotein translocase subunit SecE [Aeromonas taiwanensis]